MKQKMKNIFQKTDNIPFLQKRPLYIVLMIVFSVLLLADVSIAVLLPDRSSMENFQGIQEIQNIEIQDSFGETESTEDAGNTDDESGSDADDESGSDADSGSSDSEFSTQGIPDGRGDADESGEMPDMSSMGDGEAPDMSSMGGGEAPDMSSMGDGEMPSSFGDSESDDLSSDEESGNSDSSSDDSVDFSGRGNSVGTQQDGFSVRNVLQGVRSHWILILIILAILDAGSIFMLIRITRRQKKEAEAQRLALLEEAADGEVHLARPKKKERKHSHYLWIIAVVVIVLLVLIVKALTGQTTSSGTETEATTYSETAELGSISTVLPGTGTLEEEEAEELSLPDDVEITEWYVSDGDTVEEGDTLAAVDKVSVMTAIASVQETLTSLDEALEECEEDAVSGTITAAADGRVIRIYASVDTGVVDTMYESDALMLLSLDGYMAVSFETEADISAGDSVDVTLSDGTVVSGKVESLANTTAVVILSDEGTEPGDAVTVADEDGTVIGEGTLYIHSELKVTGFTGTVSSISVSEGDEVESGDTLISLTDTDYTGQYELLLEQRTELETQMETLFRLYEDGYIYASCSGVVSGLSDSSSSDSSSTDAGSSDGGSSDADAVDNSSDSGSASDSGSTDSASGTSASGTAGYQVQTLSCAESASVYLTIDSAQSRSAATVSSASESSSTVDVTATDDSATVSTSGDDTTGDAEDDGTDTTEDDVTVTTYIGVVTSVSDGRVTLSLLTESGSEILSLDSSTSVTIYNGSASQGAVSDIAAGDVLIVSYNGDTLSWIICISAADTSDSEKEDESTGTEESREAVSGNQEDGSAGSGSESEQQSEGGQSQTETSGTISGEMSDMTTAGSTAAAAATESAEAEEAATEALEEEVSSTYSVSETTLLSITPQNTMTIEIMVDEMDILAVEIGQEATVTLDAFPGQSFTGTVTSIDESGANSGGSSKYTAVITMDREEDMLAGMNASAVITLDTTEDVLVIPEAALVEEDNATYVYTTYDEDTDTLGGLVEVTTGISDGENVEITSGLEEGDTYCYSILDVVNYGSSYASSGTGSFSLESLFGGGGR
ncbi:MAG: HlyD family efflux transporter periplasmic adaptor subunit [Clostridiales bacterium]|nr:HlyD family efflux transporter periplasmic adaptor subunit [Clostridiales bacterium]